MVSVVYVDDDFRRMPRADMLNLQKLVDAKKFGIHEVHYKDTTIRVEIKRQGDKIVVKKHRPM
jgi:hypothetical protein